MNQGFEGFEEIGVRLMWIAVETCYRTQVNHQNNIVDELEA